MPVYLKRARIPGKTPNMKGMTWKLCPKNAPKIKSPKKSPKTQVT